MKHTRLLFVQMQAIHILDFLCLLYLYDVAIDSGEAEVLWQVSGAENCDVQCLVVRRVHDLDADFRLQIHRAIQRRGHRLQAVVNEIPDLGQRHARAIVLSKFQLRLIGE